MAKRIVKRKRIKIFSLLLMLTILMALVFGAYLLLNSKTKNIIIEGNQYLNDDYIIDLAGLKDYPSFYLTSSVKIKKKLLSSIYINDVTIKRSFYHVFTIKVSLNKALFINSGTNKIVFENNANIPFDKVNYLFRIPRLINYVPDDKYSKFVKGMKNVNSDILGKISDIEYQPNDYDKDRFLLYMDDGNMVYLTLTKFKMINYYNDVLGQLEDKKGILYLDNGNHFQIKE